MNTLIKLKITEVSSFLGQTSLFRPMKPHQGPFYNFSQLPERVQRSQTNRQYKMRHSEVLRDGLQNCWTWNPGITGSNLAQARKVSGY